MPVEPMRTQEMEVFSDSVNAPVMRDPGRRFPSSLIQGDSLSVLWGLAKSVRDRVADYDDEELVADSQELFDLIHARMLGYQAALEAGGMELPYSGRIEEDA